jgi:hypothetical protein
MLVSLWIGTSTDTILRCICCMYAVHLATVNRRRAQPCIVSRSYGRDLKANYFAPRAFKHGYCIQKQQPKSCMNPRCSGVAVLFSSFIIKDLLVSRTFLLATTDFTLEAITTGRATASVQGYLIMMLGQVAAISVAATSALSSYVIVSSRINTCQCQWVPPRPFHP